METSARTNVVDALAWLVSTSLLLLVPVGAVSGDGLAYAARAASGAWSFNPNHLLLDPAGAAWHRWLAWLGSTRAVVDELRLLGIVTGSLGTAIFRGFLAPRVAEGRAAANHATAWLVLASGYSRLLVSDEVHMIQMPWLVVFAAALLSGQERGGLLRALGAGAACGMATLCLASNGLLGLAAALVVGRAYGGRRAAAGILAGLAATAGPVLGAAWWHEAPGRSLVSWLFHYSGGATPARTSLVYGTRWTLDGVAVAGARTIYGAASSLVDLVPAVQLFRDEGNASGALLVVLAWLLAAGVVATALVRCWRRRAEASARAALLLQAVWWPAILAFGIFWNDSKQQFYFTLAVPVAVIVATLPVSFRKAPAVLTCGLLALAWNASDLRRRFVLYPRAENTAALVSAVSDACLVVVPGYDEADALLNLAVPELAVPRMALTDLAVAMPAYEGLSQLAARAQGCWSTGGRVDLVDITHAPSQRAPWKFLRALGYEREAVLRAVSAGTMEPTRSAGPFRIASVRSHAP